jgi:hypothetical protein
MSNVQKILNSLEFLNPDNEIISQIKRTLVHYPHCELELIDAFSIGQLKSKFWLIEHLPPNLGLVFICAGWYGTLARFMFERARDKFTKIRNFDINPECAPIADNMNKFWVTLEWQFKASTLDISTMTYPAQYLTVKSNGDTEELIEMPDTIINTSCEHIENFDKWYSDIPAGTIVILQNNNYFEIAEHINCVSTIEEFSKQTPMKEILYEGELDLTKYKRFMKIGIK